MSSNLIEIIPVVILMLLLVFVMPVLLRWLWNVTMIRIFALKKITYWESFRLIIISFVLFGIWGIMT